MGAERKVQTPTRDFEVYITNTNQKNRDEYCNGFTTGVCVTSYVTFVVHKGRSPINDDIRTPCQIVGVGRVTVT